MERTIDGQVIDREELDAWMRAVNGVRLALGTRLDVSEEMGPVDLDDPNAHDWLVYEILTALLGSLIAVAGT